MTTTTTTPTTPDATVQPLGRHIANKSLEQCEADCTQGLAAQKQLPEYSFTAVTVCSCIGKRRSCRIVHWRGWTGDRRDTGLHARTAAAAAHHVTRASQSVVLPAVMRAVRPLDARSGAVHTGRVISSAFLRHVYTGKLSRQQVAKATNGSNGQLVACPRV